MSRKSKPKPIAVNSRIAMEAASRKLKEAGAIADLIGILDGRGGTEELERGTLSTAALHALRLIAEARDLIDNAEARP